MCTSEMEFKATAIGGMTKEMDRDGNMPTFTSRVEEEAESGKGLRRSSQGVRRESRQVWCPESEVALNSS